MTVTKADLADHLYESVGLSKRESLALVDSFFVAMRQTLARGEPILLSGFGRFTLREKRARPGRNPMTGKHSLITARRVVTFSASMDLRKRCNAGVKDGGYG